MTPMSLCFVNFVATVHGPWAPSCGAQCALENDYQADRQETLLSRKVFKTGFKEATPHLKYFPGSAACRGRAGEWLLIADKKCDGFWNVYTYFRWAAKGGGDE